MVGGGKVVKQSASQQARRAHGKVTKQANKQARKVPSTIKPKRTKARIQRLLKSKEPKLVEDTKNLLVLRGYKTNESISQLLRDIRMLKSPNVKMLGKKNDIHVFDDEQPIEFLTHKNDASLFAIGSNTKKRPNNLSIGRTFDGHLLDVMEFEVLNFKSIEAFDCKSKKAPGSKPCFIFTGDEWESQEPFQKLQNLLLDIFRGTVVPSVNVKGLDHVIVVTASKGRALFRSYSIDFKKADSTDGTVHPRVELEEMGPRFDMSFRRHKFASPELMKAATKKPKAVTAKKVKNIEREEGTGHKMGRLHLDRQDVYSMNSRRVKALRKTPSQLQSDPTDAELEVEEV